MDKTTFDKFRQIVYEESGITLGDNKEALVSARVSKRMHTLGIKDYKEYLEYIVKDKSGKEKTLLVDAISTNVTSFFRESKHFDFLKNVVLKWLGEGQQRFRFWSAACSSGEEPYSLAMSLTDILDNHPKRIDMKILATDISISALHKCLLGEYEEDKLDNVPLELKHKYFTLHKNNHKNKTYKVKDTLKNMVLFKYINLSKPPFPMQGPLDIIMCRNVMIYFDHNIRKKLISEFYRLLRPNGYLLIGHSETLHKVTNKFALLKPSVYVKR